MSEWYNEFNSSFMLSIAGLFFGSVSACFMYCFKSKCNRIKLCGMLDIERDVEAEVEDTSPVMLPETSSPSVIEPPIPVPQRRPSSASTRRDSNIDTRVAEAVRRYQSIHTLNEPSRNVTRSNSFT